MRKLLVALLAVASLTAAGAVAERARTATAAAQTVTIGKTGYNPTAVSITTGEAVLFSNGDTVAHTVLFKPTTGMQCGLTLPLTIQPGQSASCSFSSAGKFSFSDPANKGKSFKGTVIVATPLVSSITVSPKTVVYGGKVTLAGTLTSRQAGQSLQVVAQTCGATKPTTAGAVTTTTGGVFSFQALPLSQTAYTVTSKNATSSAVSVRVLPLLHLGKTGRHTYSVSVSAAQSFGGKSATFQRRSGKRWVRVKRVLLGAGTSGVAPTVITSAGFRSGIKAGLRVRVVLGPRQVGTCYLAGRSNTIRS